MLIQIFDPTYTGHDDKEVEDSLGPETDHIEDNNGGRLNLFRSASITIEDFDDAQKSFFMPDNDTNHMLNTCFPELFTEGISLNNVIILFIHTNMHTYMHTFTYKHTHTYLYTYVYIYTLS